MKSIYFELCCGAGGDMILAGIFDLGITLSEIVEPLKTLALPPFSMEVKQVERNGIACTQCCVQAAKEHAHRNLGNIEKIISESRIAEKAKAHSLDIFRRIAQAEAKVHHVPVDEVHFHEIGAADSILDIAGACVGFSLLGADSFYTSAFTMSAGRIQCSHGAMPAPAPATLELAKGFPVELIDARTEILTPTAAGIISTLAKPGLPPAFVMEKVGYAAGQKEIKEHPNILRLWLGESREAYASDRVLVMEAGIDDCAPEILGYALERFFEGGALDVFFTAVTMKKSRPAFLITVLAPPELKSRMAEIFFRETSTIGLRMHEADRLKLSRESVELDSPWGKLSAKKIVHGGVARLAPEFEACRRAAAEFQIPLQTIYAWIGSRAAP